MDFANSNVHVHRLCFGRLEQLGQIDSIECCECSGHECHNGVFDHMMKTGTHPQEMTPQAIDDAHEVAKMEKWNE